MPKGGCGFSEGRHEHTRTASYRDYVQNEEGKKCRGEKRGRSDIFIDKCNHEHHRTQGDHFETGCWKAGRSKEELKKVRPRRESMIKKILLLQSKKKRGEGKMEATIQGYPSWSWHSKKGPA